MTLGCFFRGHKFDMTTGYSIICTRCGKKKKLL